MTKEAGLEESSLRAPVTDLFRRFGVERCRDAALTDCVSGEEVEVGFSLGGCFGAEPENQLARASSIFGLSMRDDAIARSCSVPKNSEEENRKRKGLQSLKSLEVKQRRSEKWELRTGAKHDANRGAVDGFSRFRSISQLSVGSPGSSSLSDLDYRLEHGSNSCKEVKIPSWSITSSSCKEDKIPPLSIPLELNQANTIRSIEKGNQSKKKLGIADKPKELERSGMEEMSGKLSKKKLGTAVKAKELERSRMAEMPCVSARGKDPNGRIIRGLLYKYENGVDVRIVCMCHGSFLTPTEFVKHAGGGDVAHPLRHIIVSLPLAL